MAKLRTIIYNLQKRVQELTDAVMRVAPDIGATGMAKGGNTPAEALGGVPGNQGRVYAARVTSVIDAKKGGNLSVVCPEVNAGKKFSAKMGAPFGGAGYGMFAVPGEGALVLITKTSHGWVWFSCVYEPTVEAGGKAIITQPKGSGSEAQKREDEDHLAKRGREEGDPMQRTYGVPEGFLAYESNNIPEQYIWKTPKGNKIIMSEKHTEDVEEKHITLQTAGGKRIILDDADPRTEVGTEPSIPYHQTGDRIIIADGDEWEEEGGPNRIWIQSTAGEFGVEDSIQVYARNSLFLEAREGNVNISVLDSDVEDAHILMTNLASGNLEIDIEEGDIAGAAKYRICLNAWNENEEDGPLGSIGMRSKGKFQIKNGIPSPETPVQNIQMHKGKMVLNSGRAGIILLGGVGERSWLAAKTDYMTLAAEERILISGKHIVIEGETVKINKGNETHGYYSDRFFDATTGADLPFGDESLEPCFDLQDDKDIEFGQQGSPGEGPPDRDEGAGGGDGEEVTTGDDDDTDNYMDDLIDDANDDAGAYWGGGTPSTPGTPGAPGFPAAPAAPAAPVPPQPGAPATPSTPSTPSQPLAPATPAQPKSPATPRTPTPPPTPPPQTAPSGVTAPRTPTVPPGMPVPPGPPKEPPTATTPSTPSTPTIPTSPTIITSVTDSRSATDAQQTASYSDSGGGDDNGGGGGYGGDGEDPIIHEGGGGGNGGGDGGGGFTYTYDVVDGVSDSSVGKTRHNLQNSSFPGGGTMYTPRNSTSYGGSFDGPPSTLDESRSLPDAKPPSPIFVPSRGALSSGERTGTQAQKVYGEPGFSTASEGVTQSGVVFSAEQVPGKAPEPGGYGG